MDARDDAGHAAGGLVDLKLGHHASDGIEVIDVQGEIDMYTAPRLRELLIDLVRRGLGAELGHDPAENPAVGAAGAGLLGAAQRAEVDLGGLAEGGVTGGRGEAVDRSHGPDAIRGNDPPFITVRTDITTESPPTDGCL